MTASRCCSTVIVGLALVAGPAQAQGPARAWNPESLAAQFKRELQDALRAGLAQGPAEAVAACRLRAPEIAASLARNGVRVGRASHRLRNPSNAPPEWVRPILDAYVANPSDLEPRTTALPNGQSGYVEPIITQSLCLACHGRVLAPEVAAKIADLYPEDEAVGFEIGDVRGVLWVTVPVAE